MHRPRTAPRLEHRATGRPVPAQPAALPRPFHGTDRPGAGCLCAHPPARRGAAPAARRPVAGGHRPSGGLCQRQRTGLCAAARARPGRAPVARRQRQLEGQRAGREFLDTWPPACAQHGPMQDATKIHPGAGVAMVLAAASLWGTTGTAQTFTTGQLSPAWFGALRLLVAALFFALYAWATQPPRSVGPRAALPLGSVLVAGLCMALYNLAFFAGVRQTGVALGTAVALGSGPLWAGMLQALVTRQLPPAAWWLGTGVAVAGGVLMTLSSSDNNSAGQGAISA